MTAQCYRPKLICIPPSFLCVIAFQRCCTEMCCSRVVQGRVGGCLIVPHAIVFDLYCISGASRTTPINYTVENKSQLTQTHLHALVLTLE